MKIIKIDENNYIFKNEETGELTEYSISDLVQAKDGFSAMIKEDISNDDQKLLEWAKVNYILSNEYNMNQLNKAKVAEYEDLISQIEEVQNG